jgi:hypothetical protein
MHGDMSEGHCCDPPDHAGEQIVNPFSRFWQTSDDAEFAPLR